MFSGKLRAFYARGRLLVWRPQSKSNSQSNNLEIRGFDSSRPFLFQGWISPRQEEAPAVLDAGLLVAWILRGMGVLSPEMLGACFKQVNNKQPEQ